MALFDTTADAYAIEIMPPEDHSRVQSFMTGGRATGLIVLSFIFGILAARFGFSVIFLVISVVLLLPLIMLFQVKEPQQRSAHLTFDWSAFRVMLHPNYLLFAFFLILAWYGYIVLVILEGDTLISLPWISTQVLSAQAQSEVINMTKIVASPNRKAVTTLPETPKKGQSPRKYASTKLFTSAALMKIDHMDCSVIVPPLLPAPPRLRDAGSCS